MTPETAEVPGVFLPCFQAFGPLIALPETPYNKGLWDYARIL
jgi:hypothetical protein